jgi:hypothetical protein
MIKKPFPTRALALGFFFAAIAVWLPCLQIYLLNAPNLTIPLSAHLPELALLGIGVLAVVVALQVVVPARLRQGMASIILATGIFLWAESTLLIGNYGFLKGEDLDWGANRYLLYLEIVLAGLLVLVLLRMRETLLRRSGLVMLVLTVSSAANLYTPLQAWRDRTPPDNRYTFTQEALFQLSADRNVLLFVIDTFQADVFAELVAENPHYAQVMDGFTFFPDATSTFPKTYASIPNILTGQAFDNSQPFSRYLTESYLADSAPHVLKKNGFDVRFHSFTWQPYLANPEVVDNLALSGGGTQAQWMQQVELTRLLNLLLFRLSPSLAKPWIFNDNRFRLQARSADPESSADPYPLTQENRRHSAGNKLEDLEFLDRFQAYLSTDGNKPAFRVYHLAGAHAPFYLDPNLEYLGKRKYAARPFREQCSAMLRLMELVFARLKELKAYDNSLILVVADHGNGEMGSLGIQQDGLKALGWNHPIPAAQATDNLEMVRGGIPLMMVKAPGARGPLKLSDAPVELSDIPATIFQGLGLKAKTGGRSLLAEEVDPQRRRLHRFYRFAGWGQDFIVPMTEYEINGFSWDPASWSPSDRDLNQVAVDAAQGPLVILGDGGNLEEFRHSGWSGPQVQGRFIADRSAKLVIPLAENPRSALLKVTMKHFPIQSPAPLTIHVNGELTAVWTVCGESREEYQVFLPDKALVPNSDLELTFGLAPGMDPGPQVVEAHLEFNRSRPALALDHPVQFTPQSEGAKMLVCGWYECENWAVWSSGFFSSLAFSVQPERAGDLVLDLDFVPALFGSAPPVKASLWGNGICLGEFKLTGRESSQHTFRFPSSILTAGGNLDLTFRVENPRSPRDFGQGTDPRNLGLALKRLSVGEAPSSRPQDSSLDLTPSGEAGQWTGLHRTEDWGGKAVTWTDGKATCRFLVSPGQDPGQLMIDLAGAASGSAPLIIKLNGKTLLEDSTVAGPWSGAVEIPEAARSGPWELVIESGTFVPGDKDGAGDQRSLGVALRKVVITR